MPSLLTPSTPQENTQSSQELDALAARAFWTSSSSSSSSPSSSHPCPRRLVCFWCLSLPPPHLNTSRHVCSAAPRSAYRTHHVQRHQELLHLRTVPGPRPALHPYLDGWRRVAAMRQGTAREIHCAAGHMSPLPSMTQPTRARRGPHTQGYPFETASTPVHTSLLLCRGTLSGVGPGLGKWSPATTR